MDKNLLINQVIYIIILFFILLEIFSYLCLFVSKKLKEKLGDTNGKENR